MQSSSVIYIRNQPSLRIVYRSFWRVSSESDANEIIGSDSDPYKLECFSAESSTFHIAIASMSYFFSFLLLIFFKSVGHITDRN